MEIKELKERVAIEKKKVEASQKKRDAIVILSFVGVYFLLLYFFGEKPVDFNDYFSLVLAAVFCGVLHHAINGAIYEELQKKEESERRLLDELQKEIYQKEQEQFERSLNTTKERIHQQRIKEK